MVSVFDGVTEFQGVPKNDNGGEQVQTCDPVVLAFGGAITDFYPGKGHWLDIHLRLSCFEELKTYGESAQHHDGHGKPGIEKIAQHSGIKYRQSAARREPTYRPRGRILPVRRDRAYSTTDFGSVLRRLRASYGTSCSGKSKASFDLPLCLAPILSCEIRSRLPMARYFGISADGLDLSSWRFA
ncbi:hypothetical protein NKJ46_31575 [Mesorhizobium sp. M0166]